ncbi:MAG: DUF896 domain-containing protein [Firmicutes bacterium]|nr:DUF896 domain-containing protein [Bacillota bacterium]
MITKDMMDRINFLAKKQRTDGLSDQEKNEQHVLRQKYLQSVRQQLVDGLEEAGIPRKNEHDNCSCGECKGHKH